MGPEYETEKESAEGRAGGSVITSASMHVIGSVLIFGTFVLIHGVLWTSALRGLRERSLREGLTGDIWPLMLASLLNLLIGVGVYVAAGVVAADPASLLPSVGAAVIVGAIDLLLGPHVRRLLLGPPPEATPELRDRVNKVQLIGKLVLLPLAALAGALGAWLAR
jgi:hypothetical protein